MPVALKSEIERTILALSLTNLSSFLVCKTREDLLALLRIHMETLEKWIKLRTQEFWQVEPNGITRDSINEEILEKHYPDFLQILYFSYHTHLLYLHSAFWSILKHQKLFKILKIIQYCDFSNLSKMKPIKSHVFNIT